MRTSKNETMRLALIALWITGCVSAQSTIAINNVTVVDVEKGSLRSGQTVVIQNNRVAAVDEAVRVRLPSGARAIDGRGKFQMPGLWDMHVQETPSPHVVELYIANGVTGIRDMYDDPAKLRAVRQAIADHRRVGPRVVASGRTLNGFSEKNDQVPVVLPEQGRQAVRQLSKMALTLSRSTMLFPAMAIMRSRMNASGIASRLLDTLRTRSPLPRRPPQASEALNI